MSPSPVSHLAYNELPGDVVGEAACLDMLPTAAPVVIELDGPVRERVLRQPGRALPQVAYRARRWLVEIANHLNAMGNERAQKRADNICECTRYTRVPVCECGTPASGRLGTKERRCHARSCPRCGPARADELRDRIRAWMDSENAPRGSWWHVVFTTRYDSGDPAELTREALRHRLDTVKGQWRKHWRKHKGAAALVGAEIGRWGAVHLHALVATDSRPNPESSCGSVWVSLTPVPDPARAIGELVKYAAKTPCRSADWWTRPAIVPHPKLIAAWEMATFGARLVERYGSARSLPELDQDDELVDERKCDKCARPIDQATIREIPTRIWCGWAKHLDINPFHRRE